MTYATYTEGGLAVSPVGGSLSVYFGAFPANDYAGLSVTLARYGAASSDDVFSGLDNLTFTDTGEVVLSGITVGTVVGNDAGVLKILFNHNATQTALDEVLSDIGYANASDTPPARVEIVWSYFDTNTDTALSSLSTFVDIVAVNDAPVLHGETLSSSGLAVAEGDTDPAGFSFSDLGLGVYADADGNTVGMAITALDSSLGTWQYSTDSGASWLTIDSDLIDSSTNELALLLGPTAKLRLLPFGDLNGTLGNAVQFRAWDMTSGSQGDYVQITATGGSTAFSSEVDSLQATVTAVNDAPTFSPPNGTGSATAAVTGSDVVSAAIVQPDGKIVVTGSGRGAYGAFDYFILRMNADGSPDTSFNGSGKQLVSMLDGYDYGSSVALQPDGKIVVGGYSYNVGNSYTYFSLLRLNADGSPDTTFNGSGDVFVPGSKAYAVAVQPDGKILAAGSVSSGVDDDFAVVRLNADGLPDTSFNGSGELTANLTGFDDVVHDVVVQPDGKILLAGQTDTYDTSTVGLVRLNADGSLDTTFNGTGKEILNLDGNLNLERSMTLQADGKVIIAAFHWNGASYEPLLVRLNSDGSLDASFNGTGKEMLPTDLGGRAATVIVQPDGKIIVGGDVSVNYTVTGFKLIRLEADGSLDTSFNGTGDVVVPVLPRDGGTGFYGNSNVTLQTDGKIIVAGSTLDNGGGDVQIVRLNADGSLDTTFNPTHANTLGGTAAYTEGAAAVALDDSVAIYDTDLAAADNYAGASVTLARNGGASSDDVFSGLNNLVFTGGNAVLSGITIGTVDNSAGTLKITFNDNATQARVDEALSSIGYANASDAPPASAQIDWSFSDGNAGAQGGGGTLTAAGSTTVNFTAVNDAPTAGNLDAAESYTEDTMLDLTDIVVSDVDGMNVTATLTLSDPAGGSLSTGTSNSVTSTYDAGSGLWSAAGAVADVHALLASVTFAPAADFSGSLTIATSVSDGTATITGIKALTGIAANDAAIIGGTHTGNTSEASGVANGTAGTATTSGTLTDTDVDNPADTFTAVTAGTASDRGYGTFAMTAGGVWTYTLDDSNATVQALNAGQSTSDTFTVTTVDGTGQTVTIVIQGANDNAVIGGATTGTVVEAGGALNGIPNTPTVGGTLTASDVDNPANAFVAAGSAGDNGWGTFAVDAGGHWTYTLDNNNATVQALGPSASMNDTFTVHTIDGTPQQVTVTVAGANDAPSGSVTISGHAMAGSLLTASASLADVDGLGALHYQWQADGANVGGDSSTYTLAASDAGKAITVTVSYVDGGGTSESMTGRLVSTPGIAIYGTLGADHLIGTSGDDLIDGGSSRDSMEGGLGNDTYYVNDSRDMAVENPAAGTDSVYTTVAYTLLDNVENLTMTGTAAGALKGNAGANTIIGNSGANQIDGCGGADTITGGAGADLFCFTASGDSSPLAYDTVMDFSMLQKDKIDLHLIDAREGVAGDQAFKFIGTAQFSDFASGLGLLRFDPLTHMLEGSTDADLDPEFRVLLVGIDHLGVDTGGISALNIVL